MTNQRRWMAVSLPLILLAGAGCAHFQDNDGVAVREGEAPRSINRRIAQEEPTAPLKAGEQAALDETARLKELARTLDLTQEGTTLKLSSGGTSVYAEVHRGGRAIGAVIPMNTASVISGEIMSYHLGRVLGVAELEQPGFYYFLTGPSLEKFKEVIPQTAFPPRKHPKTGELIQTDKESNRLALLKLIEQHPEGIPTVFKAWDVPPVDFDQLVQSNSLNTTFVFPKGSAAVAQLLLCEGPQPTTGELSFNRGKTTELKAARQLSNMFLVDAMMSQWDRFSGGNLQTATKNGEVKFFAFDNGGTNGSSKDTTDVFITLVSRFDRAVAERILELDKFLNGKEQPKAPFLGLKTEAEFLHEMDVDRLPGNLALNVKRFKQAVATVASHIRSKLDNPNCFFPEN